MGVLLLCERLDEVIFMGLMELTIPIPECQQAVRLPAGTVDWSEDEFFHFCQINRDLRIERTAKGEIIIMSPASGYSGFQSGEAFSQLKVWATKDGTGAAFDSSTGFLLPTVAMRAPDAAWVRLWRLRKLSRREKEQFIPLCPDFAIEVASPTDRAADLIAKMEEYRTAGLTLGWLILPATKQVEIHTAAGVEVLASPDRVAADPFLPGFTLELGPIWDPPF
ncbi:MAG: Uma2 family endonuclease [Terriglobia bacterium]